MASDHPGGLTRDHVIWAYRLLLDREIEITPMHATALALGIHEDTGSLTYTSTTPRDVDGLAACLRLGSC